MPEVEAARKVNIGSSDTAAAVARVLAGASKQNDGNRFMPVIKEYFRRNPEAQEAFADWYTDLPGDEDSGEAKSKGKKAKRKRSKSSDEDDED